MVVNLHIKASGLNHQEVEKTKQEIKTSANMISCIENQIEGEFSENG